MGDSGKYTCPSIGDLDVTPLTGPPTKDGCLYVALRLQRLGIKDRLQSAHQTPEDAYKEIVRHVGHAPEDYTPDFPDDDWGDKIWGWHTGSGATYIIQQYRWSGIDKLERSEFPTDKPSLEDVERIGEKPRECPECGSWETERVNTEFWGDEIQVTRICNACPTQYDVMYGDPYKRGIRTDDPDA